MISLLNATKPYIEKFKGIRISTRPDYINSEILDILKSYNVTTIELGAQSMDDSVLFANNRGHNSQDVINASKLIKEYGFNLGLQMMIGLYRSTIQSDIYTANEFIKLKPTCVRIYPTVVMKNTDLGRLYQSEKYVTYTLDDSVSLCADLLLLFEKNYIDVIRLGLHYSESLVNNSLSKGYHPAFKELCENKIFFDKIISQVQKLDNKNFYIIINPKSRSKVIGQKKNNINKLENLGYKIEILTDSNLGKYEVIVKEQE